MKINKDKFNKLLQKDEIAKQEKQCNKNLSEQEEIERADKILSEKIEEYMAWCISLGYVSKPRWSIVGRLYNDNCRPTDYCADKVFQALKDNGYMLKENNREEYAWVKLEDQNFTTKLFYYADENRFITLSLIVIGIAIVFYLAFQ